MEKKEDNMLSARSDDNFVPGQGWHLWPVIRAQHYRSARPYNVGPRGPFTILKQNDIASLACSDNPFVVASSSSPGAAAEGHSFLSGENSLRLSDTFQARYYGALHASSCEISSFFLIFILSDCFSASDCGLDRVIRELRLVVWILVNWLLWLVVETMIGVL